MQRVRSGALRTVKDGRPNARGQGDVTGVPNALVSDCYISQGHADAEHGVNWTCGVELRWMRVYERD